MPRHYVLVDRDGVVNVDLPGSVLRLGDFELLPHVAEAIAQINRKGYGVLIITNQACIGRGELSWAELDAIHSLMHKLVARAGGRIEAVHVCPHVDEDGCACRKPRPGLIQQAQRQHDFACADTWMVGDAGRDIEAAVNAGCRPALVRTGQGSTVAGADVPTFDDLRHFAAQLPPVRTS